MSQNSGFYLKKITMKKTILLVTLLTSTFLFAQDFKAIVTNYLTQNRSQLGLQEQDYTDLHVDSHSFSRSMNLENVYVSQQYQGIQIFNSTSSFAIKNSQVLQANLSFINNLQQKITATATAISSQEAIQKAAAALSIETPSGLQIEQTLGNNSFVYNTAGISQNAIPVKLVYQPLEDGTLKLAWDLSIYLLDSSHYYSVRIDALTGDLLSKHDWVISCDFGTPEHAHNPETNSILFKSKDAPAIEATLAGGTQYRVYPLPLESPNHGTDVLVSDPANPIASPFGWHDTDGTPGAEFTVTRGNNVWAQDDLDGNNGTGTSPDGGPGLNFDFAYNENTHPQNVLDANTVNLFYWNNIIHDVFYQYGFDEASGNFQENNYGNGGSGSDSVNADAQDGSGTNNANFSTPPDGSNSRMQMFLWNPSGPAGNPLTINNGVLAGDYAGLSAGFGAPLPIAPGITADLALVLDDNSGVSIDENDACDPITNGIDLNGKIVVIRRGECEFGFKILAAENEGAVAVIMVNNVAGDPIVMGAGALGGSVTIPAIMVSQADGEAIIAQLEAGATISATLTEAPPFSKDGDLDNGIIVHEYGHGISTRLTGGPFNSSCLQNDEQMGEGWSDWFGLVLTIEPGDLGTDGRGIGTYATSQPVTGQGIRGKKYSTDFTINNYTYGNVATQNGVHAIGEVWATVLWDLTWAFIDQDGFDPDVYNGTGGNNKVMQLVIDGLKLQGCNPGFVSGRDAILQADELANGGANRCLIWNTFAARGLGVNASQGSPFSSTDQTEDFDIPSGPNCTLSNEDRGSINDSFLIYPNPSNGNINIKTTINVGDVTVSIYDVNGRKVFTEDVSLQNLVTLNTKGLTTGVYVVQIIGNNINQTSKLIMK
jgi:hypothetical protein